MRELMLQAVIRMPYEMAMATDLSRRQYYERANQALNELEACAATRVREALEEAAQACEARIGQHCDGMSPEDVEDCDEEARECAAAIRTLIPK